MFKSNAFTSSNLSQQTPAHQNHNLDHLSAFGGGSTIAGFSQLGGIPGAGQPAHNQTPPQMTSFSQQPPATNSFAKQPSLAGSSCELLGSLQPVVAQPPAFTHQADQGSHMAGYPAGQMSLGQHPVSQGANAPLKMSSFAGMSPATGAKVNTNQITH